MTDAGRPLTQPGNHNPPHEDCDYPCTQVVINNHDNLNKKNIICSICFILELIPDTGGRRPQVPMPWHQH